MLSTDLAICYLVLLMAACAGVVRFRHLSSADKVLAVLLLITIAEEAIAFYWMRVYKNNLRIFHIYTPIELLLICIYFDRALLIFRRTRLIAIIGVGSVALSIANTVFLQPPDKINSYFLLYEGAIIIGLCLISLYQVLMDEQHLPYRFVRFWITLSFLLYWSITFTGWGIYTVLGQKEFALNATFTKVLYGANLLFYLGIFTVLLRYKKMIPSGA